MTPESCLVLCHCELCLPVKGVHIVGQWEPDQSEGH